jgi:excisionase family DNA binding protein
MTAQPRKHRDREPGPADSPRRTSGPPPEDDIALGTASCAGRDSPGGRLAYSVDEAARLTGLSRDLLYDQMHLGNLAYVKVARRCLITCQHMQRLLGIGS